MQRNMLDKQKNRMNVKAVACRMFRFALLSGRSSAAISLSGGRAGWFLSHLSRVWITQLQGNFEPVCVERAADVVGHRVLG